jgi:hypothetical protein
MLSPFKKWRPQRGGGGVKLIKKHIKKSSDINLKQNIQLLDINITDKLMNLKPSSFEFKNDRSNHYTLWVYSK